MTTLARRLGRVAVPTHEEACDLARRRDAGDPTARNELVERNIPLAAKVVAAVSRANPRVWDDLLGASMIGLIRAADRFDPDRGIRFSTYATYWIRQAVTNWFADESHLIRIPRHIQRAMRLARRGESYESTKANPSIVASASLAASATAAGSSPCGPPDLLSDLARPDATPGEDDRSTTDRLRRVLAAMPARDAEVIRLRFGLDGEAPMTLEQVGDRLSITKERVRQVLKAVLGVLAGVMEDER